MGRSGQRPGRTTGQTRRQPEQWQIDQQQAYVEYDPQLRSRLAERLAALDAPSLAGEGSLDSAVAAAFDLEGLPLEDASGWDVRRGGKRWERYPDRRRQAHEHVPVEVLHAGQTITLDETIAPLIEACWQNGLSTVMSCEENFGGRAWIQFASLDDCYRFLQTADSQAAADAYLAEVVEALTPGPQRTFEPELQWWPSFDLTCQDDGWTIRSSVRFPAARISSLAERLDARELAA